MAKVKRNFRLDSDLMDELKAQSAATGEPMTQIIERCLAAEFARGGTRLVSDVQPALDTEVVPPPILNPGTQPEPESVVVLAPEVRERMIRERAEQLSDGVDLDPPELRRRAIEALERDGVL